MIYWYAMAAPVAPSFFLVGLLCLLCEEDPDVETAGTVSVGIVQRQVGIEINFTKLALGSASGVQLSAPHGALLPHDLLQAHRDRSRRAGATAVKLWSEL